MSRAGFLGADLPSEDEEDLDYVPNEVDEEERAKKRKKARRVRGAALGAGTGEEEEVTEEEPDELTDTLSEHKRAAKRAKVDALWSQLQGGSDSGEAKASGNADGGAEAAPAAAAPKSAAGFSLAALCRPVSKKSGKAGMDDSWMRQLGLAKPKGGKAGATGSSSAAGTAGPAAAEAKRSERDTKTMAMAALAAAKAAASATAAQQYGTVTVQEQRRFAGQTITVNKEVAAGSKEAARAAKAAEEAAAARNKAGLDAVLASLAQAKKVGLWDCAARTARSQGWRPSTPQSLAAPAGRPAREAAPPPPYMLLPQVTVLDKSRADWKDYKKGDEVVEEELELHKRSGGQYLDKQARGRRDRGHRLGAWLALCDVGRG